MEKCQVASLLGHTPLPRLEREKNRNEDRAENLEQDVQRHTRLDKIGEPVDGQNDDSELLAEPDVAQRLANELGSRS